MSPEDWQIVWFTAWVSALSTIVILPFGLAAGGYLPELIPLACRPQVVAMVSRSRHFRPSFR